MSTQMGLKNDLPKVILFVSGMIVILSFFTASPELDIASSSLTRWVLVISSIAALYAFFVFLEFNINKIRQKKELWILNIYTIILTFVYIIIGTWLTTNHAIYQWLYNNINLSIGIALTSTYILLIYSVIYRAFNIRNVEAGILAISCIIIMMMNTGLITYYFPQVGVIGTWILNYPQKAGARGLLIAASIGTVALAARILIGKEVKFEAKEGGGGV